MVCGPARAALIHVNRTAGVNWGRYRPWRGNHRRVGAFTLSPADWQRVKAGEPLTVRGRGYVYDKERFGDIWRFNGSN
jgi:hypothetical protein